MRPGIVDNQKVSFVYCGQHAVYCKFIIIFA